MTDRRLPGPGSLSWKYLGQARMLLVTGRALVLEAALPAGGAALARHSTYRTRPLRRLELTLDSLQRLTYGDEDTREREVARIRRAHRHINGTDEQGRPYDGLDDTSRAWIMLTLFDAMVTMERLGGKPLAPADEARLYDEWRTVTLAFGIGEDTIPADLAAHHTYFAHMVEEGLEDNPEVRHLLGALYASVRRPPFLARCPAPVWEALVKVGAVVMGSVLRADLPAPYRARLGLRAGRGDRAASWLLHRTAALLMAALPLAYRYLPLASAALRGGPLEPRAARRPLPVQRGGGAEDPRPVRVGRFFDDVLDQTGDGFITREDLQAMVRTVCWHQDLTDDREQQVYRAFDAWWEQLAAMDGDGDGRVSRDEFVTGTLTDQDRTPDHVREGLPHAMGALFDVADVDGGGQLDMTEYRRLFGSKLHPADLNRGFQELDADGDGEISRAEFLAALTDFFTARSTTPTGTHLFGR
ncbi:oxygenase MpaB family protein [Streptomyces sp. NPDC087440]|uniref:oxygenase MpaB family protein n=1 Tax=Streptomyces sp. NPDC087440 TaxID=3365790 RepID=UPI0038013D44